LAPSLAAADLVLFLHRPELAWDAAAVIAGLRGEGVAVENVNALLAALEARVAPGDTVVFRSNGGFEGAPARFAASLNGAC
jgi:UDP-N-acetylmuramate: L-alanyl-gamma-D-glutamyl-meso-diaminopimelate ligase